MWPSLMEKGVNFSRISFSLPLLRAKELKARFLTAGFLTLTHKVKLGCYALATRASSSHTFAAAALRAGNFSLIRADLPERSRK